MTTNAKIWQGILGSIAVLVLLIGGFQAHEKWTLNEAFARGAQQQAVVAQWFTNDLLLIVAILVTTLIVALVSFVISQPTTVKAVQASTDTSAE